MGTFAVKYYYGINPPSSSSYDSNTNTASFSTEIHKIIFDEGILDNIPETFVSIGEGTWEDNQIFGYSDDLSRVWKVEFEKSVDNPGHYRVRPYCSGDAKDYFEGDDPFVIIIADNPDKVYLEKYSIGQWELIQKVPENGISDSSSYGKMEDGKITIPAGAFSAKNTNGTTQDCGKYDLVITLPEDYFQTPSSSGVYFGITAFNYEPKIKAIELINKGNKGDFKAFVNEQDMADATYLYYSADVAIDALASRMYPEDLNNVALITFTDGNDDGSLEKADPSWSEEDYQNHLKNRLSTVKVQGLPIDAYSIGLKGKDIGDYNYPMFRANLEVLASNSEQATEVSNMKEVESTINDILDNLEKSWTNRKVTCNINMRATGDRIRFTLDKTREEMNNNPDNSSLWIEGIFSRDDNSLNDVSYHGMTSTSGSKVVSTKVVTDGRTKYSFTFENLRDANGNELEIRNIEFWHRTESNPVWQPHTEFKQGTDAGTEVERTSAAIMFVMDCSTSLGDDFPELQRVVNVLIDRLVPEGGAGVDAPVIDEYDTNAPVEYYNLQGIRVENPQAGLYIRRTGKKVEKVLIR